MKCHLKLPETDIQPADAILRSWVMECSYRDWSAVLHRSDSGWHLQVEFWLYTKEGSKCWRGRKWYISSHATKSEVVQTVFFAVLQAEEHEVRERFTFQGKAIFGPHYDVQRLHSLCLTENHLDVRSPVEATAE